MLDTVFDGLIAVMLIGLAWTALNSRDLFRGIVLYIAYGLILSFAWIRLEAADVALAEAALGAGLTGALLIDAARQMSAGREPS